MSKKGTNKPYRLSEGVFPTAIILLSVLTLCQVDAQGQAKITEVFEMVENAGEVTWFDLDGNSLEKGRLENGVTVADGVKRGGKFGTPSRDGLPTFYPEVTEPVIDVNIAPSYTKDEKGVKAVWENRLPIAKTIQAEISADVVLNRKGEEPNAKVLLRVETQDINEPGAWRTEGIFDPSDLKTDGHGGSLPTCSVAEEKFRTYSLIADLCEWSGQYVRLSFEIHAAPFADEPVHARWLKARLVTANFVAKLVGNSEKVNQTNVRRNRRASKPRYIGDLLGSSEYIFLENAANYPDTSLTVDEFHGHTIGYYAGDSGSVGKSTMIFDRPYAGTLGYGSTVQNVTGSTVRNVGQIPTVTGNGDYLLWPALQPVSGVTEAIDYELDNHYAGVDGVSAGLIDGTTEVLHAVVHTEDKYYESLTKVLPNFWRIGYARTRNTYGDHRDAYWLYRMTHSDGEDLPGYDCPQSAGWGHAIITPDYSEADARAITNKPATWHIGTPDPHIVADATRYYCFHTYWEFAHSGTTFLATGTWGISVASCLKSELDVSEDYYRTHANPWNIYDEDSETFCIGATSDRSGYDMEDWIILEEYTSPVVSWNDEIDMWVMFTEVWGSIYMFVSSDLVTWNSQSGLQILAPGGSVSKYYHQSCIGTSDKLTHYYNELYYMAVPSSGSSNDMMYRGILKRIVRFP